jgi:hypothetical protein
MRFDVLVAAPANGPFDAAMRSTLNAALRADYNKAPIALPPATVKRQVSEASIAGPLCTPLAALFLNAAA